MKTMIDNYTFDKTAGTVTFTDIDPVRLDRILLIADVTTGLIIYSFADPTKGGSVNGSILTLAVDTSALADDDALAIFYDDFATVQPISGTVTIDDQGLADAIASALADASFDLDVATQTALADAIASALAGLAVTGPLTDTELRDTPVPVSGDITVTGLPSASDIGDAVASTLDTLSVDLDADTITALADAIAGALPAGTGLTDAELRATPVPVSGTVAVTGAPEPPTASAIATAILSALDNALTIDGTVTVQDGGNVITVDGSVSADTELPAAAALADAMTAPSVPGVAAYGLLWNGSGWDRVSGSASNGIRVDTGLAKSLEDAPHSSGDAGVMALTVRQDTATALAGTSMDYQPMITDSAGRLHVDLSRLTLAEDAAHQSADPGIMALGVRKDAAAATAGSDGDYMPFILNALGRLHVVEPAWTPTLLSALKAAATIIDTAAGRFGGYMFMNLNSVPAYVQVFDLASATTITLGSTTPTFVIPIPANSTPANGAAAHLMLGAGIAFALGLRMAATTTATGATQVTTGLSGYVLTGAV